MLLTDEQDLLLTQPIDAKIFVQGKAGSGKTTAGVHWLQKLMKSGVPPHQILVFTPQRTLAQPYLDCMHDEGAFAHSLITTMTLGGLARRMVDLFWPLISEEAGFAHPNQPPHFLTLESGQYYMAHVVRPLIENEGYFESLAIHRNRIYAQILDNLNKAAIVGFPYEEIGPRLKSAWIGGIEQFNIYDDVQRCADHFRQFCLAHNLLDFSLQVEVFLQRLWPLRLCREHLVQSYRHLIADNIEEDTPVTHDVLRDWLPEFESALLIADEEAGFRSFLGADVISAFSLGSACETRLWFKQNLVNETAIAQLKTGIQSVISQLQSRSEEEIESPTPALREALGLPGEHIKLFPSMVKWVTQNVAELIESGVPPAEIVLLAPYMPDVLRFALGDGLDALGIPHQSHRPSRALRDEPATQTLLSLASIAHPGWSMPAQPVNLALALMQAIEGLDLVRAQLLVNLVFEPGNDGILLKPFEAIPNAFKDRITYRVGERYDRLRQWLLEAAGAEGSQNLDFFLSRLFGEVLSQPGFGFHDDLERANTVSTLIESVQKFRWTVGQQLPGEDFNLGKEYLRMVQDGVIAAQYLRTWEERSPDAVFMAPAYTFLISNQPVDVQFWLDIGSPSWYQRLDQPLTHPYVLSRHWTTGDVWDADNELAAAHETLRRLSIGLLNRCRKKVYIGMSALDIRGYENRGLLIRIINEAWRRSLKEGA
ncbi:MAG TPA: hypothetical protein PLE10_02320 [Brevefilum sp.]|nr:hypothetical protein [Brevefilum sp.]